MRILIADDHPIYLEAIAERIGRSLPEATVECLPSLEGLNGIEDGFDLLLVDYSMPGIGSAENVGALVARGIARMVVVMSGVASPEDVAACVAQGARGFLPKSMTGRVFVSALNVILDGGTYIPAEFVGVSPPPVSSPAPNAPNALASAPISESIALPEGMPQFTDRELSVLAAIVEGKPNKVIARELGVQEVTIKLHLSRIFQKLGVHNRSQAAVAALRLGISAPTS